jgi:ornithine cyclodeaminase/alanine dehydrogenase-like protein (mu-crystallin family)
MLKWRLAQKTAARHRKKYSTGTALQDVAAAELVCEKAVMAGSYPRLNFAM